MSSSNKISINSTTISDILSRVIVESLTNMRFFGFILLNKQGEIVHCNEAAQSLFRLTSECRGMRWLDFFSNTDQLAELPLSHMILCSKEGECAAMAALSRADGSAIEARLFYRFIKPTKGSYLPEGGYCVFVEDNSYVKRLEGEIESLRHSSGLDSQDSAASSLREICHKMRSPLTLISLSVNLLRDYSDKMSAQERSEELKQIEEGLNSCEKILSSLASAPASSSTPNPRSIG